LKLTQAELMMRIAEPVDNTGTKKEEKIKLAT